MFSQKIANEIKGQKGALKIGFHLFKNSNDSKHYFYFVDDNLQPILISKVYQSARTCRQALNRIRQANLRIKFQQKKEQFFFQIQNGNKQAVATSKLLPTAAAAKQAANSIEVSLQKPSFSSTPTKHSFRIDFYQGEKGKPYRGIIEHLITREKESFKGVEIELIKRFLQKFIQPIVSSMSTVEEEKKLPIKIMENGKPTARINYPIGTALQIALPIDEEIVSPYEAQIYLNPLATGDQELICKRQFTKKEEAVNISVKTDHCMPGFYRLIANLEPTSIQGSRIVQLY